MTTMTYISINVTLFFFWKREIFSRLEYGEYKFYYQCYSYSIWIISWLSPKKILFNFNLLKYFKNRQRLSWKWYFNMKWSDWVYFSRNLDPLSFDRYKESPLWNKVILLWRTTFYYKDSSRYPSTFKEWWTTTYTTQTRVNFHFCLQTTLVRFFTWIKSLFE